MDTRLLLWTTHTTLHYTTGTLNPWYTKLLAHYTTGADLSRVDTSADDIRKDARATLHGHLEKLRGVDPNAGSEGERDSRSECLGALSTVAELCREEGAAGEANRAAVGEVHRCAGTK